jgi:NADP-dependent 3-hydroxy acid dehydrogenase YdfG
VVVQAMKRTREQIGQVLQPGDIADAIVYAATRPPYVCLNEVVVRPTGQAR